MKTYKWIILNLDCASCANELERALQKIKLIENVQLNFITQKLTFECSEENKEEAFEQMKKTIKKESPEITIEEVQP